MREVTRSRTESATTTEAAPALIDARTFAEQERHDRIFASFNALPQGGLLDLINDHDPAPLYRKFKSSFHGLFTWDYLEQGPELWRVRIGKAPGNCCGSCS